MDMIIYCICSLGALSALITVLLNTRLIWKIVLKKTNRNDDMQLFYNRFLTDTCFGTFLFCNIVYTILSMKVPEFMVNYNSFIVYSALPWSHFAACRSAIALSISFERFIAAYFPILYRTTRSKIPNWLIFLLAISFGFSEEIVLFKLCNYKMDIPLNCRVFGCAVNSCFYSFWTIHKSIIFFSILVFSILISIKLFIWNTNRQPSNQISKANRLALLDTFVVLLFDFLPSFCGTMWPTAPVFSFDVVGPYNSVLKITGCAIESIVVSRLLVLRKDENSVSIQNVAVRKASSRYSKT